MDGPAGREESDDADGPVEVALALLERLEHAELSVKETLDRIEAVTTAPALQRRILEEAERRGIIERDGPVVYPRGGAFVRFDSEVIAREGEFSCERCGADLSTGYFIDLDPGEVGPYGSTCIRKVTGRE